MKRVSLFLPEQLIARVKRLSEHTGLTVAEHVRRALDEYMTKQDSKGA